MAMDEERVLGEGTLVKADLQGGTNYQAISCVQEVAPPDEEVETHDGTCLDDDREQSKPGMPKASEFSFKALWRSGSDLFEDLQDARRGKVDCGWQLVFPFETPKTETFTGFIKKLSRPKITTKEFLSCEVTVVTTSESTIT